MKEQMGCFYWNLPGGLSRNDLFSEDKIKLFNVIDNIIVRIGLYKEGIMELNSTINYSDLQVEREHAKKVLNEISKPVYEELRKRGFSEHELN